MAVGAFLFVKMGGMLTVGRGECKLVYSPSCEPIGRDIYFGRGFVFSVIRKIWRRLEQGFEVEPGI